MDFILRDAEAIINSSAILINVVVGNIMIENIIIFTKQN